MADSDVQIAPDGSGKQIDTSQIVTGAGTVQRQRVSIGDPTANTLALVKTTPVAPGDAGLVVRPHNLNWVHTIDANPTVLQVSGSGTFTQASPWDNTDLSGGGPGYSKWRAFVQSDQGGTLSMQQSPDNSNWYTTVSDVSAASVPLIQESLIALRYLRLVWVNGSVTTTTVFVLRIALVAV